MILPSVSISTANSIIFGKGDYLPLWDSPFNFKTTSNHLALKRNSAFDEVVLFLLKIDWVIRW